jgi:hypothetical protein
VGKLGDTLKKEERRNKFTVRNDKTDGIFEVKMEKNHGGKDSVSEIEKHHWEIRNARII